MKKMILSCLLGLLFLPLLAQNAKIQGHIYNEAKENMPYTTIMLLENGMIVNGTYSDENGVYIFAALKAGTYSIKVSHLGFPDVIEKDLVLTENTEKILDIYLKKPVKNVAIHEPGASKVMTDSLSLADDAADFSLSFRGARDGGGIDEGEADGDGVPDMYDEMDKPVAVKHDKPAAVKYVEVKAEASKGISSARPLSKKTTMAGSPRSGSMGDIMDKKPLETTPKMPLVEKGEPAKEIYATKLTAGEVNDFAKWKMWKEINNDEFKAFQNEWKMVPKERYVIQVNNEQYQPMPNLKVELRNKEEVIWTGRTDNTGKAELWADFFQQIPQAKGNAEMIRVYFDGKSQDLQQISPFKRGINYMTIAKNCEKNLQADIAFVVDATGSMGDEIAHLRADLSLIAGTLKDTLKGWDVNFASVFYQDHGDAYLTKSSPFSVNVAETQFFMQNTPSGGGGDTPEAVEAGLEEAIQQLKWNENASTRIMFLVLDAPAHQDIETLIKLQMQIRAAAHKGIRIIPVACSGIDKSTEYLLRSIALATNGTYAFLTDDSGIGGGHIKPTTDDFKVEKFYQLAVRLVCQYTYQPDCKPVTTDEKPKTETVYQSKVIEKTEKQAEKDKDNVLGKNEENNNVWVIEKTPSWKYFPNPTQGNLTIEVEGKIGEIFLCDVSGKILERYAVKENESFTIDLSAYANGMYFLRYEYDANKWLSGKVILQR